MCHPLFNERVTVVFRTHKKLATLNTVFKTIDSIKFRILIT